MPAEGGAEAASEVAGWCGNHRWSVTRSLLYDTRSSGGRAVRRFQAMVTALLMAGGLSCNSGEGVGGFFETWWATPVGADAYSFVQGGVFWAAGMWSAVPAEDGRDLVQVAVVHAQNDTADCATYTTFLGRLQELQGVIDHAATLPESEHPERDAWVDYLCGEIDTAAREAFGGDGNFRAVHLLIDRSSGASSALYPPADGSVGFGDDDDSAGDGDFPCGQLLDPDSYAVNVYERHVTGSGILPVDSDRSWQVDAVDPVDGCATLVNQLLDEPDASRGSALALAAVGSRYGHAPTTMESLPLPDGELPIGVGLLPDSSAPERATIGALASVWGQPEAFPYAQVMFSSSEPTELQACEPLGDRARFLWPRAAGLTGEVGAVTDGGSCDEGSIHPDCWPTTGCSAAPARPSGLAWLVPMLLLRRRR